MASKQSVSNAAKNSATKSKKSTTKAPTVPKTMLDKVVACILELDQSSGSSRKAIIKLVQQKYNVDNTAALGRAIKSGVAKGTLIQNKQSFLVAGHTPSAKPLEEQLAVSDIKIGSGTEAVSASRCTMKYVGTLEDGIKFDSASKFTFTIDGGEVIKAWDQGVKGMRVGGRRKLTCPPKLAYGKRGSGPDIPPNATLMFDITLLKVE